MGTRVVNWISYLALTLAALLFTLYYRQSFFLVLTLLLIFLPAVSYALCRYAFSHTDASLASKADTADKPAALPLLVTIANKSFVPLAHFETDILISSCFYPNSRQETLILPAHAKKTAEYAFPVAYAKSGCYQIHLLRAVSYDFLHLFRFARAADAQTEVVIMPRLLPSSSPREWICREGFDEFEETGAKGNVSSNVTDVREYRPGDRLQKIHWKLTARTDNLMVKENEATASNRFVVLTELYQPAFPADGEGDEANAKSGLSLLDRTLDYAFSLGCELLEAGESFFFACYSIRRSDFLSFFIRNTDEFYHALALVFYERPYEEADLGISRCQNAFPHPGTLLHVTHEGVNDVVI